MENQLTEIRDNSATDADMFFPAHEASTLANKGRK
jgi:hypothetical protein